MFIDNLIPLFGNKPSANLMNTHKIANYLTKVQGYSCFICPIYNKYP